MWTLIAAFLVLFIQAGFAMVEAGFTRAKNAANILMKNFMDFGMGSIAFFFVGFGLMFGAYLVFSVAMCAIVHPVFGSWAWGSLYKAHRLRLL